MLSFFPSLNHVTFVGGEILVLQVTSVSPKLELGPICVVSRFVNEIDSISGAPIEKILNLSECILFFTLTHLVLRRILLC